MTKTTAKAPPAPKASDEAAKASLALNDPTHSNAAYTSDDTGVTEATEPQVDED